MQPQHWTEYMTWYTPETEIDVQTVCEELGCRAMELKKCQCDRLEGIDKGVRYLSVKQTNMQSGKKESSTKLLLLLIFLPKNIFGK